LENLRKEVPAGLLEMLSVAGLRPDKVLRLYMKLGIASLADPEAAAKDGSIRKAKGLGAALQDLQNLTTARSGQGRLHAPRPALLETAVASLRTAPPRAHASNLTRMMNIVGKPSLIAAIRAG
jgi:DNA polymerase (family X)